MSDEIIKRVARDIHERAIQRGYVAPSPVLHHLAVAAIESMRELPEQPGPRYSAGEYSRRTQAAMVDDALSITVVLPEMQKTLYNG